MHTSICDGDLAKCCLHAGRPNDKGNRAAARNLGVRKARQPPLRLTALDLPTIDGASIVCSAGSVGKTIRYDVQVDVVFEQDFYSGEDKRKSAHRV